MRANYPSTICLVIW